MEKGLIVEADFQTRKLAIPAIVIDAGKVEQPTRKSVQDPCLSPPARIAVSEMSKITTDKIADEIQF